MASLIVESQKNSTPRAPIWGAPQFLQKKFYLFHKQNFPTLFIFVKSGKFIRKVGTRLNFLILSFYNNKSYSLKKTKATINFPSPISNKNNASLRRNTGAHRRSNPPFVQCAPMRYIPLHIQSALVAMRSSALQAHTPKYNLLFEQCVQIH